MAKADKTKTTTAADAGERADRQYMVEALRLAAKGRYTVSPNPKVGAVLVRRGVVVGRGFHRRAGEPHAETLALREAGTAARGSTLYINLEPCSHWGKTPPCSEAIVTAGVKRVVVSHADPDSRVAGRGLSGLREVGVEVEVGPGRDEAIDLNWTFLVAKSMRRPAVTLKWAMSLDGKIATSRGESRWISSPEARDWALRLREERDAILVGSGTVLADDPRLTRREGLAEKQILRVVMDRRLRVPPRAALFDDPGPILFFTESRDGRRRDLLEERGAIVRRLDKVTPDSVIKSLAGEGVQSLLVEGGGQISAAFAQSGLIDEVFSIVAPRLIGGDKAPGPVRGVGFGKLSETLDLEAFDSRRVGADVILHSRRVGVLSDLHAMLERIEAGAGGGGTSGRRRRRGA